MVLGVGGGNHWVFLVLYMCVIGGILEKKFTNA